MIIDKTGKALIGEFTEHCIEWLPGFRGREFNKALNIIEVFENSTDEETIRKSPYVRKWYASLKKGEPDYSIYEGEYYLASSILCYINYTRNMLKMLFKHTDVFEGIKIKRIVDYGCGVGYSTLALKEHWPKAEVWGTNYSPSQQLTFTKKLFSETNVIAHDSAENAGPVSLGFAAEYFEHFKEPLSELDKIMKENSPKVLVTCNSFAPIAVGHFDAYNILGVGMELNPRKTTLEFNKYLKGKGYVKYSNWWNGRPNVWVKEK